MTPDPSMLDQHTDAAIEALVEMYLTRPAETAAESAPATGTADRHDAASTPQRPAPHPAAASPAGERAAPAHVEAVLIGHLPGLANPWLSQYADFRARPGRPVVLCHLFADQVELELVRCDPSDTPISGPDDTAIDLADATDFDRTLAYLAPRAGVWLVPIGSFDTPIAQSACAALARWTLLSGADEAAAVAAYRLIKHARLAVEQPAAPARHLQIMFAGCDEDAARQAADKITRAARQFLQWPARRIGLRSRMQPLCKQRIGVFHNETRSGAEPRWARLLRFVTEELVEPPDMPSADAPPVPSEAPPLRLHVDTPATDESPSPSPPPPRPSTGESTAGPLVRHVEGLELLPVRCPLDEQVELAIDAAGAVHLLCRADGPDVFKGAAILLAVRAWVVQHAALLHQACDVTALNTAELFCHLFTDTPRPVAPFCLAGGAACQPIKLHLLQVITDTIPPRTVHVELN